MNYCRHIHPAVGAKIVKMGLLAAAWSSNPGVAFGSLRTDVSSIGPVGADSVPLWNRQSFLRNYAEQLEALPSAYPVAGSGSWQCDVGRVVESNALSTRRAQSPYLSESVADSIAAIRSAFSLQVKELAQILKVERPTVYAWMKGGALPQHNNQIRLRQIHRLANRWNRLSERPAGKAIHELDATGRSVLDYLKESILPEELIAGRLQAIVCSQSNSTASGRPRLSELAQKHGIDLTKVREQVEEFDIVTGKPFRME